MQTETLREENKLLVILTEKLLNKIHLLREQGNINETKKLYNQVELINKKRQINNALIISLY